MHRITTKIAVLAVAVLYVFALLATFGPPSLQALGQAVASATIFGG